MLFIQYIDFTNSIYTRPICVIISRFLKLWWKYIFNYRSCILRYLNILISKISILILCIFKFRKFSDRRAASDGPFIQLTVSCNSRKSETKLRTETYMYYLGTLNWSHRVSHNKFLFLFSLTFNFHYYD